MKELEESSDHKYPPGPTAYPLVGNIPHFLREGPALFERVVREFGDIVTVRLGRKKLFVVSDPDLIRNILVKDNKHFTKGRALGLAKKALGDGLLTGDGPAYARNRGFVVPAFSRTGIEEVMEAAALSLKAFNAHMKDGDEIDISEAMSEICLKTAAQAYLGVDISENASTIAHVFDDILAILNRLNLLPEFCEHLPLPMNFRLRKLRSRLHQAAADILASRRQTLNDNKSDLLGILLRKEEQPFTESEWGEQITTLLFAGYEAPARVLSWSWYLLDQSPQKENRIAERFHEEIDSILQGRDVTAADIQNLQFTRAIILETMRLYPPVWMIARKIVVPYELRGYALPVGSEIFVSPYIVHRDPRHYSSPLQFKPERWLDSSLDGIHKFAFFPFGGGARGCIGAHLANPEMIMIMASIGQKWNLQLKDYRHIDPNPAFTFGPSSPIKMVLKSRKNIDLLSQLPGSSQRKTQA
jgi:cytochrome P450